MTLEGAILSALLALTGAQADAPASASPPPAAAPAALAWDGLAAPPTLSVTSATVQGGRFADSSSGYGAGRSPQVAWSGAPAGTRSFALLVEDRDAARNGAPILHWSVFDIPASTTSLPENASADPAATFRQGANVAGAPVYRGPHPPRGTHRYAVQVYAVDRVLDLPAAAPREAVLSALQGHVLARGKLEAISSAPEPAAASAPAPPAG